MTLEKGAKAKQSTLYDKVKQLTETEGMNDRGKKKDNKPKPKHPQGKYRSNGEHWRNDAYILTNEKEKVNE